jgi:methylated-DNA-[protein]-cysteine S-methyltransferase
MEIKLVKSLPHHFNNFMFYGMIENIFYNSPIGTIQITGTDKTLQAVSFVHTEKNSMAEKKDLKAPSPASVVLRECVHQLDQYFSGSNLFFDLPLEQPGTVFQKNVWNELKQIKPGATMSYMQLSKKLGNAKAIRAVGNANGKNTIAIIVPCHRVIGTNGHLVGYAGDLWRKKWLLQHEARYLNGVQTLF